MILSKLQHRLQNQQQTKRLERCGLYEKYKKQAAKQPVPSSCHTYNLRILQFPDSDVNLKTILPRDFAQ